MKKIELKDIKPYPYEGYIWMSDQKRPSIFNGDCVVNIIQRENAFIAEGLLWHSSTGTSISISYHDGHYHVFEVMVSPQELHGCDYTSPETYIAHRITGVNHLSFVRYWQPVADSLCEGFEVYTPQTLVFTGFCKINN